LADWESDGEDMGLYSCINHGTEVTLCNFNTIWLVSCSIDITNFLSKFVQYYTVQVSKALFETEDVSICCIRSLIMGYDEDVYSSNIIILK